MAEFCIDCWNKMNGTDYTERDVRTEEDLCEGCGQWKPVIVSFREWSVADALKDLALWLRSRAAAVRTDDGKK